MNYIRKNKLTVLVIVIFAIVVILAAYVYNVFFSSGRREAYGNRLDGIEAVEITDKQYDEIKDSPDQNCLLRSIGSKERFKPEISLINSIEKGDAFLLCSDGFWEYISTKEVLEARKKSATASRWLAKMLRVVQSNGASVSLRDNISAITVIV